MVMSSSSSETMVLRLFGSKVVPSGGGVRVGGVVFGIFRAFSVCTTCLRLRALDFDMVRW